VTEYCANVSASGGEGCDCTDWTADAEYDTQDDYIGFCSADDNCCVEE